MKETTTPTTPADVNALIAQMDGMLAQGREAMERLDQFYHEHGLTPGFGKNELLSDKVPDRHRTIFARLLAEFTNIEQRIEEFDPSSKKNAPVPVSARAVGNRYRI